MSTQKVTLSASVEMDLTFHQVGIVAAFDKFRKQNPDAVDNNPYQTVFGQHLECYAVYGTWLVAISRGPDMSALGLGNPADLLRVHIFSNIPMQTFATEFWKFAEALGIRDFELLNTWYIKDVKSAAEELFRRGTSTT